MYRAVHPLPNLSPVPSVLLERLLPVPILQLLLGGLRQRIREMLLPELSGLLAGQLLERTRLLRIAGALLRATQTFLAEGGGSRRLTEEHHDFVVLCHCCCRNSASWWNIYTFSTFSAHLAGTVTTVTVHSTLAWSITPLLHPRWDEAPPLGKGRNITQVCCATSSMCRAVFPNGKVLNGGRVNRQTFLCHCGCNRSGQRQGCGFAAKAADGQ